MRASEPAGEILSVAKDLRRIMVEAAGVEPASETTSNRERSCFFHVLFVSSPALRTDEDTTATSLIDLTRGVQAEHVEPAYCATLLNAPVGEARGNGYLFN